MPNLKVGKINRGFEASGRQLPQKHFHQSLCPLLIALNDGETFAPTSA
jgi:hypothetical protein